MIRILIVDDSPMERLSLRMLFMSDAELAVVGEARSGEEAIMLCRGLQPDIVTLDINVPGMGGYEVIRHIMSESPRPIIVLTTVESASLLAVSFKALSLGALTVMAKPCQTCADDTEAQNLITQIKMVAGIKVVHRPWGPPSKRERAAVDRPGYMSARKMTDPAQIVAIGVSTGGPLALRTILGGLPAGFPVPIVIVQHISNGFIAGLISWLSKLVEMRCQIAEQNEVLRRGTVYLAPDERHLLVRRGGTIDLEASAPVDGHCPSATALFESVAHSYGPASIGVLLTGMGRDGATGLQTMCRAGAHTIAQDEPSSVVYGMPKAAVELGVVVEQLPLHLIAGRLIALTKS